MRKLKYIKYTLYYVTTVLLVFSVIDTLLPTDWIPTNPIMQKYGIYLFAIVAYMGSKELDTKQKTPKPKKS